MKTDISLWLGDPLPIHSWFWIVMSATQQSTTPIAQQDWAQVAMLELRAMSDDDDDMMDVKAKERCWKGGVGCGWLLPQMRCIWPRGFWRPSVTTVTSCQELNNSGATPDYFSTLLRSTFPHYSGLHSRATPVHTPVLLQSTTGLDWTPLDLLFDQTCAWLDMGSSCHSSVTYVPISCHLYLLVLSLFSAHIYLHLLISTSVVFASHWQWLSLGTYCPLSSFVMLMLSCHWDRISKWWLPWIL